MWPNYEILSHHHCSKLYISSLPQGQCAAGTSVRKRRCQTYKYDYCSVGSYGHQRGDGTEIWTDLEPALFLVLVHLCPRSDPRCDTRKLCSLQQTCRVIVIVRATRMRCSLPCAAALECCHRNSAHSSKQSHMWRQFSSLSSDQSSCSFVISFTFRLNLWS